ncbi:MAG: type II toxin-antitoxin system VapC family toxin [Dechloromonas sp.]|jgi:predicted nucleic acid-binding protein|nr:type II toxin-antitoxin system VapC family toxin [Dechloromonas sp.]
MQQLTLDASVLLKWFFQTPDESDFPQALAILNELRGGRAALIQPPHTLLEVAAVLIRKRPESIAADLDEVGAMLVDTTIEASRVLPHALHLAEALDHHLSDTLYHATAMVADATLITADRRYFDKANSRGRILLLEQYSAGVGAA